MSFFLNIYLLKSHFNKWSMVDGMVEEDQQRKAVLRRKEKKKNLLITLPWFPANGAG